MSSRDEKGNERWLGVRVLQGRSEQVRFHVVDGHERPIERKRHRLRPTDSDQQCPDQSGAGGGSYDVDAVECQLGPGQRLIDHIVDLLQMRTSRELGDHAPEHGVLVLREYHVSEDPVVPIEHRGRGLVARGLQPKHERPLWLAHASPVGPLRGPPRGPPTP